MTHTPMSIQCPGRTILRVVAISAATMMLLLISSCDKLDDEPLVIEWDSTNTIVCYGNSLTVGMVEPDSSYPAFLDEMLAIDVVARGQIGATSKWGLDNLSTIYADKPALVILEFGANDFLDGSVKDSAFIYLTAMIEELQAADIEVALLNFAHPAMLDCILANSVIISFLPPEGIQLMRNLGLAYDAMIDGLAIAYDLLYEDYLYEDIACEPTMVGWDGIHPNEKGNLRQAQNVYEEFYDVFERSGMLK